MESFPQVPGYVVTGKLGSGSDSEVFKCRKKNSKKTLAVKIITKNQGAERLERSRKEVEVLSLLQHHPHIIRMHEWFETDDALYIVLENAEGGDLFEVLYSNELNPTQSVLEEECARRYRQPIAPLYFSSGTGQLGLAANFFTPSGYLHRPQWPCATCTKKACAIAT